jgi:hypothetical protein
MGRNDLRLDVAVDALELVAEIVLHGTQLSVTEEMRTVLPIVLTSVELGDQNKDASKIQVTILRGLVRVSLCHRPARNGPYGPVPGHSRRRRDLTGQQAEFMRKHLKHSTVWISVIPSSIVNRRPANSLRLPSLIVGMQQP